MDTSAGFLRVFGLIGFGHFEWRNSELFVVQLKPLTESIALKNGGNKLSLKQAFERVVLGEIWMNFSQDMAQRRS